MVVQIVFAFLVHDAQKSVHFDLLLVRNRYEVKTSSFEKNVHAQLLVLLEGEEKHETQKTTPSYVGSSSKYLNAQLLSLTSVNQASPDIEETHSKQRPYSANCMDFRDFKRIVNLEAMEYCSTIVEDNTSKGSDNGSGPQLNSSTGCCDRNQSSQDAVAKNVNVVVHEQLGLGHFLIINQNVVFGNHEHDEQSRAGTADDGVHDNLIGHGFVLDFLRDLHVGAGIHEQRANQDDQRARHQETHIAAEVSALRVAFIQPKQTQDLGVGQVLGDLRSQQTEVLDGCSLLLDQVKLRHFELFSEQILVTSSYA